MTSLSVVVAVARNDTIGREGRLPWHLRTDLQRFRRITTGHAMVMGRRTWESIGRPLPGRLSIVVTSRELELPPAPDDQTDVCLASDLDAALGIVVDRRPESRWLYVIGGAALYREALPRADEVHWTRVEEEIAGDVFLPELAGEIAKRDWRVLEARRVPAGEHDDHPTTYLHLRRDPPIGAEPIGLGD